MEAPVFGSIAPVAPFTPPTPPKKYAYPSRLHKGILRYPGRARADSYLGVHQDRTIFFLPR